LGGSFERGERISGWFMCEFINVGMLFLVCSEGTKKKPKKTEKIIYRDFNVV